MKTALSSSDRSETAVQNGLAHIIITVMVFLSAIVISLIPFHALLTVWAASRTGHYTLLRLWKEFILALLVVGAVLIYFVYLRRVRRHDTNFWQSVRRRPLVSLIAAYVLLLCATGLWALHTRSVTPKAAAYGLLLDTRFLIFFLITGLLARFGNSGGDHGNRIRAHYKQLILIPAAFVAVFAVLQFTVLPHNFLFHFGYGSQTIYPMETIDHKDTYPRVQSTLRGANPLGAYLIVVICAAGALLLRVRDFKWRGIYGALLLTGLAALLFSFSRSAWIGAALALALILWLSAPSGRVRRWLLATGVLAMILVAGAGFMLRTNDHVQNALFHTDEHSRSSQSSNAGHIAATKAGLHDIVRQPLGGGTGTAGPASVYNNHPARIAENYFLQVGQEAGLAGLVLFAAINVLVAVRLLRHSSRDTLSLILFVSLVGITVVNLLSHAWTDDTLAYLWWGLAGAALGSKGYNKD